MTKVEFIIELNNLLTELNKSEREEAISFYVELIEDKVEKGINEVEAVNSLGDINDIASQILEDRKTAEEETTSTSKESSFEYVTEKSMNVFNKLVKDFDNLSRGMKIVSIVTLVISIPIIIGYFTSIVPLVLLVLMIYLVWSIKNEKHSQETLKSMKTVLKVILIISIIVYIPLLIALYLAPILIFGGTTGALLITGLISLFNLSFVAISETLLVSGFLMTGIAGLILAIMLIVSIYKVLNHCLRALYDEVKREVA